MQKTLQAIIFTILITLPSIAVDCQKKPCHRDCIDSQPRSVQTQCKCDARKNFRYWVPEYNSVCDGSFEEYRTRYCAGKIRYDNQMLSYSYSRNNYTPEFDPMCDTQESYFQKIQSLKQMQSYNKMIDALTQPVQVNVRSRVDTYSHY